MNKIETVSSFQLFSITLFSMLFGLNLYPLICGYRLDYEFFIAQIISFLLVIPIIFAITSIKNSFNMCSVDSILRSLLGNVPSRILGLVFFSYFILHSFRIITLEAEDIQLFLFDKTPVTVIALVLLLVGFIISINGSASLLRTAEVLSIPILLTVILMLTFFLCSSDFGEIKTLLQPRANKILSQIINSVSCFVCIESTLFFVCRTEKKSHKALYAGFLVCAIVSLFITICITGIFTLKAGAVMHYPVTELSRTVQLKYLRVIERFDSISLSVKIISTCIFTSIMCYCASSSLALVFKPMKFRYSIPVYLILIILIFLKLNKKIIFNISQLLTYWEILNLFLIIPLIFIISRKKVSQCISSK